MNDPSPASRRKNGSKIGSMPTLDMRQKSEEEVKKTPAPAPVEAEEKTETPDETSVIEETLDAAPETETSAASSEGEQEYEKEVSAVQALKDEQKRIRDEISQLRTDRRDLRQGKKEEPVFVPTPESDALADVAEADITLVEKILKAKGYVRKDELSQMTYKERVNMATQEWLKEHSEYMPDNDPNDDKWNALNGVINAHLKAPANPGDFKKTLDLAHKILFPTSSAPVKSKASTDALKEKMVSSSKVSSGGAPRSQPLKEKIDPRGLIGFTDEEIKEIFS